MSILDRFRLDGKTALITGGGQGIGRAYALALAEAGANVAIVDVNATTANQVAEEIRQLGRRSLAIMADVTRREDVASMVQTIVREWGKLDIGVNNAGVGEWVKSEEMPEEKWDWLMDINLKGVFLCAQAEAQVMIPRRSGKIISTASMSGSIVNRPQPQAAYNASKAAVIHLTRSLAAEWAQYGINVNCISPGYIYTPLIGTPERAPMIKEWLSMIPQGRVGQVTDLQGAIVYLASEASDYMTGHDLVIDGGYTAW
ncbi:MAG: SDR family oxidoreductase [Chloroflexi bacterium]|nr:SDR family oxidoreductase [Chloroflexota bacterium]